MTSSSSSSRILVERSCFKRSSCERSFCSHEIMLSIHKQGRFPYKALCWSRHLSQAVPVFGGLEIDEFAFLLRFASSSSSHNPYSNFHIPPCQKVWIARRGISKFSNALLPTVEGAPSPQNLSFLCMHCIAKGISFCLANSIQCCCRQ